VQREVALSTTEAECNAMSEALRSVISMMELIDKAKDLGWKVSETKPNVHCKVFEDNSAVVDMVKLPKMRARTKHVNVRMHHFREHVRSGRISVSKVPSRYQLADLTTKPQPKSLFVSQRESIMQWEAEDMTREELLLPAKHLRACEIIEQFPLLIEQESSKHQPAQLSTGSTLRQGEDT